MDKPYIVTVTEKYPSASSRAEELEITAKDANEANKKIRRRIEDSGNGGRLDPLIYHARRAK